MCHDGKGKLFLTKRSKNTRDEHGRWDSGAGGLKHGQTLIENLERELMEEYGVKPLEVEFIGYLDVFRTNPEGMDTHWLAMFFAVKVNPKHIKIGEPEMIDDQGWFSLDDLPSPLHSHYPKFFATHGKKLRKIMKSTV